MTAVTTPLPNKPLLETKTRVSPAEFARLLREQGPVFKWEPDRFWVVTDHELATAVLKGSDFSADRSPFFRDRPGCPFHKIADFFGLIKKMMVMSDPPEHTARRKLAAVGIADKVLDQFSPKVDAAVEALLDTTQGKRSADFVTELATPLPGMVLADLFCVPESERAAFFSWANDMTQFFGGASQNIEEDAERTNRSAVNLRTYFTKLIADRRKRPQEDFLSHLIAGQQALGLDDTELVSQSTMMLVAGTVTASDQLCNNMHGLLTEPGLLARLRANPSLLDAALEEVTRLDPSVDFVFRVAAKPTQLGRAALAPGELVFISIDAVNRDPRVFEAPERLRLDRDRNPHMSFGSGIHYCLGARLGRIEMRALFGRLLERYPNVSLDPERPPRRKEQSLAFSGFDELALRLA